MTDLRTLFENLHGHWVFSRRVTRLASDEELATATGEAVFTRGEKGMAYRETGQMIQMKNPEEIFEFHRDYLYTLKDDYLLVYHGPGPQQGQLYQTLALDADKKALLPTEDHLCGADCYTSRYELIDAQRFNLETIVKGPHKNHTIHTEFIRKLPVCAL